MSILNEYTKEKHREIEAHPFVQYMLHGQITKEHYAMFLQQMFTLYSSLEYFAEMSQLFQDLDGIKRAEYIQEDIQELGYFMNYEIYPGTEKYRQRIVELYYGDKKPLLFAHVYVRHMGDMYGGKAIAKRVPGSGKMYHFENRPNLIKTFDSKLTLDLVDEALIGFDLAAGIFDDLYSRMFVDLN
jgi:heme oxygenase